MKPTRPTTFMLTLPNGERVECWRKEAELIRADVHRTGTVQLVQDPVTGVYCRVPPGSQMPDGARRIA